MCRMIVFTNGSKLKPRKDSEIINAILLGASQKDGFGYAMLGSNGVFGERAVNPELYKSVAGRGNTMGMQWTVPNQNSFGKFGKIIGAAMFHGRTSTNTINLKNTHPLVNKNWTLIHNGVINNHGPEYKQQTDNDTEHLLHYMSEGKGIEAIEQHITGYYAFAAIDPKGYLHIVKDNVASLFSCYSRALESFVFSTAQDILEELMEELEGDNEPIQRVTDNVYMIFDGNALVNIESIKPRGTTSKEDAYRNKSLGKGPNPYYSKEWYEEEYGKGYTSSFVVQEDINDIPNSEAAIESLFQNYRTELERVDNTYDITDWNGRLLSIDEFKQLDLRSQLDCLVIRSDNTIMGSELEEYTEELIELVERKKA